MKRKNRGKKLAAALLTCTLGAAAMMGGTYAWQMISQNAPNQVVNSRNPGGRLHDDFNGLNTSQVMLLSDEDSRKVKNVYVENFTSVNDGDDIYARVRLDEYLEIGAGAGRATGDAKKFAVSVETKDEDHDGKNDITIEDEKSWTTYQWDDENSVFRKYITLGTGSTGRTGGDTVYLPTYNQDRDSLESDVNGTLAGPDGVSVGSKDAYEDYAEYTVGQQVYGIELTAADEQGQDEIGTEGITAKALMDAVLGENGAFKAEITDATTQIEVEHQGVRSSYAVTGKELDDNGTVTALYLDLTDDGIEDQHLKLAVCEPHEAKATLKTSAFLSMKEWQEQKNGMAGAYWVYDTDGWVYWAQPISPGTATGCLLNSISVAEGTKMPSEYFYGLNVVAQFATKGAWDDADHAFQADGGITPEALELLNAVSGTENETTYAGSMTMNVTADKIVKGAQVQFTASITDSGTGVSVAASKLDWAVTGDASGQAEEAGQTTTTISENGLLTIGENETSKTLTVTATYRDSLGLLWKCEKVLELKDFYHTVTISSEEEGSVEPGATRQYQAKVSKVTSAGEEALSESVIWKLSGNASEQTTISENGLLTVAEDETATPLNIRAVYEGENGNTVCDATECVDIKVSLDLKGETVEVGGQNTITIDGLEWYILAVKDGKALLWAKEELYGDDGFLYGTAFGNSAVWRDSDVRAYLNGSGADEFLGKYPTIAAVADKTTIKTRKSYDSEQYIETTDKVFLLTEADIFGTQNHQAAKAEDYTAGVKLTMTSGMVWNGSRSWLRSPLDAPGCVAYLSSFKSGALSADSTFLSTQSGYYCLRPAFWMDLSSSVVYEVEISAKDSGVETTPGNTVQYTAEVKKYEGLTATVQENASVTWSVEGNQSEKTKISKTGLLSIAADETAQKLTVKAEYIADGLTTVGEKKVYTKTVEIEGTPVQVGSLETVRIADIDWYVLTVKDGKALLWAENVLYKDGAVMTKSRASHEVGVGYFIEGKPNNFVSEYPEIAEIAEMTLCKKNKAYKADTDYEQWNSRVFELHEADLVGDWSGFHWSEDAYTAGERLDLEPEHLQADTEYWLYTDREYGSFTKVEPNGMLYKEFWSTKLGVRPAFWYKLAEE